MNLSQFWRRSPKIGTPENPEILEPGWESRPRASVAPSRVRTAGSLLRLMLLIALPATVLDWLCVGLFKMTLTSGADAALGWLLLIFFAPAAFLATCVALLLLLVLTFMVLFTISGRGQIAVFGTTRRTWRTASQTTEKYTEPLPRDTTPRFERQKN